MKKNSIEYEVIMEATTIALVKKRLSGNGKEEIGMNLALERKNIILWICTVLQQSRPPSAITKGNNTWLLKFIYICEAILTSFCFQSNRLREQPHSERDTTSPTLPAVVVERFPSTSKRRLALPVDTQQRRWETLTGDKRLRAAALPELDVCVIWRIWPVNSRMDSERELKHPRALK